MFGVVFGWWIDAVWHRRDQMVMLWFIKISRKYLWTPIGRFAVSINKISSIRFRYNFAYELLLFIYLYSSDDIYMLMSAACTVHASRSTHNHNASKCAYEIVSWSLLTGAIWHLKMDEFQYAFLFFFTFPWRCRWLVRSYQLFIVCRANIGTKSTSPEWHYLHA